MKKLWRDVQAHHRATVLLLGYWLATLAVIPFTWAGGIPLPVVVLLLTTPLIAGTLVGWWRAPTPERTARSSDRLRGGALAGALSALMTFVVMKGGVVDEVIGWTHGHRFQGDEVVAFFAAAGVLGALLGSMGAGLAMILHRFCGHGGPTPSP